MTAEEYIKNNASGQGGFESVSVDVALWAIEYAKHEAREQMMKDAVSGKVGQTINGMLKVLSDEFFGDLGFKAGDKVKLIIIKEDKV